MPTWNAPSATDESNGQANATPPPFPREGEPKSWNAIASAVGRPAVGTAGFWRFITSSRSRGAAGTNYLRRPRPVGPCFIFDEATCKARTMPAFVQLGVDVGGTIDATSWMKVPATILPDRAGFRITPPGNDS